MKLIELFKNAERFIHHPVLTFPIDDGKLKITKAARATDEQFPNLLYIKYNGKYVGKITKKEEYVPTGTPTDFSKEFFDKVREIIEDPVGCAIREGRTASFCCFCGTRIVTKESLAAGYGPICADKWGLPWGFVKEEQLPSLEKILEAVDEEDLT